MGGAAPANSRNVGKRSMVITVALLTRPATIRPGHETIPAPRWPPSNNSPFCTRQWRVPRTRHVAALFDAVAAIVGREHHNRVLFQIQFAQPGRDPSHA